MPGPWERGHNFHLIVQRDFKSLSPSKSLRTTVLLDEETFLVAGGERHLK